MDQDAAAVRTVLRRIARCGDFGRAPKWAVESLQFGDYVRASGPIEGVSAFNCYALTERGRELLA